jgi:hypothetical protein
VAIVTSYTSLVTAVSNYIARDDVVSDVPGFIWNFERRFLRQPKNFGRWMEVSLTGTTASGVLAVPAGFQLLKYAYINGSPSTRLEWVSLDQCYGRYPRGAETGRPCWITRDVENLVFGPFPDADYDIRGVYYGKPTAMKDAAADAVAHWLIVNAPDLCLYGSLLEAEAFVQNDTRIAVWRDFYGQALKDYRDLIHEEVFTVMQEVLA